MTKVTLNKVGSGYRSVNVLNNDLETIEKGFERTLDRFGGEGNHMEAPLDMNSNRILNLPEPTEPTDPLRLQDLLDGTLTDLVVEDIEKIAEGVARETAEEALAGKVGLNDGRTLVVLGSSNVAGMGASGYTGDPVGPLWASPEGSWVKVLEDRLKAVDPAWKVYNLGVSGSTSGWSVDTFMERVAPLKPSHIIFGTHVANDGFDTTLVLRNTLRFCRLAESIGAVPIVRGGTPWPGMTATQLARVKALNAALDQSGYRRIDNFSALADPSGAFINTSTVTIDAMHPNDLGYRFFADAIDITLFFRATPRLPLIKTKGAITVTSDSYGIRYDTTLDRFHDHSVRILVSPKTNAAVPGVFAQIASKTEGTGDYRLEVRGNPAVIRAADGVVNSLGVPYVPATDAGKDFDLVLTLRRNPLDMTTGTAIFYHNGVQIDTVQIINLNPFGSPFVDFWGMWAVVTAKNWVLKSAQVWKAPLPPTEIETMYKGGEIPKGSLVLDLDLSRGPAGATETNTSYLNNLTSNGTHALIREGAWTWA